MKPRGELAWVDCCKGVAMLWIFCNHVSEQLLGYPLIANPSPNWPPFAERLAQLRWLDGYSLGSFTLNLFRYVGWFGDQGVGLFLILSGFGLTWGLLRRQGATHLELGPFYWRRAERIYPLWWTVHLLFMASWLITEYGLPLTDPSTYLSFLGIRISRGLFYYFTPAWWYIGLLIQLYLVYPVLWNALRKWGPVKMLIVTCSVSFVVRMAGLMWLHDSPFVDKWSLGAVFICRLPDFALGIFLAVQLQRNSGSEDSRLRSLRSTLLAAVAYLLGISLSLTLPGMTFAPFLLGYGAIVLLYQFFQRFARANILTRILGWVGKHSYSLYLIHHPLVLILLPFKSPIGTKEFWVRLLATALTSVIFALFLEKISDFGVAQAGRWWKDHGPRGLLVRIGAIFFAAAAVLFAAELSVWKFVPQEVLGWGEKPSLELHPGFGWRLKRSQVTRLRWEGYDYVVSANSLGFPGPEYPVQKPPGTFRILTTGDAFTSAEGVNTAEAWPRLLESNLSSRVAGHKVEVLNFAITGYGPNEYAAVVKTFAPLYHPDLILIEFFVNEYSDVLHGAEFAQSIGIDRPSAESWYALIHLVQLRHIIQNRAKSPLLSLLRGRPEPYGYFLGNFAELERSDNERRAQARRLVANRLQEIKATADAVGAQAILLLVPAPVQVCGPSDLHYFPHHVDLTDKTKFDLDLPQRITRAIALPLGFEIVDLQPILKQTPGGCPYQPWNMHWTAAGHRQVAESLADTLISKENLVMQSGDR